MNNYLFQQYHTLSELYLQLRHVGYNSIQQLIIHYYMIFCKIMLRDKKIIENAFD